MARCPCVLMGCDEGPPLQRQTKNPVQFLSYEQETCQIEGGRRYLESETWEDRLVNIVRIPLLYLATRLKNSVFCVIMH